MPQSLTACGISRFRTASPAPGLWFTDLTRVALPATTVVVFPVGDPETPPPPDSPFFVTVALAWTGVSNVTTMRVVDHVQISPTVKETFVFHDRTRNATTAGSGSYISPLFGSLTLTGANASFVQLNAAGVVEIGIEHQRPRSARRNGSRGEIPTNHNPNFAPVSHPILETGLRRWSSPRKPGWRHD
ncbi:MAG TPA: hypothetical protein VE338_22355 [Ktedonobacterales bacterium]|jgi:hypothetical protein|nr:hypothetical protein [Ktedonobacterales bacterium]